MAAVHLLLSILALSFSSTPSFSQSDNDFLLKFKQSLNINGGALDSWDPKSSPCKGQWHGVYCNGGIITGIHLTNISLSGTIDIQSLNALPGLKTIRFDNNSFSGTIPPFNKLTNLRNLYLSINQFSGEIPNDYFSNMTNLKRLSLANNKFTGKIPESIMKLPFLVLLHLEGNQFSGTIPQLREGAVLSEVDMSHNHLEGQIPSSYSKYPTQFFEGNNLLCGKPLNDDCSQVQGSSNSESSSKSNTLTKVVIAAVVAAVIVLLIFVAIVLARRRRDPNFRVLEEEHFSDNETVEVNMTESIRRPMESSRKGSGDSNRRGSQHGKNGMGDLVMVNDEKGAFGLADLMKAAAEVLGNGSLGSSYKAVMANGLSVVVKRIRDMNKMGKDGFHEEIRRFGRLSHPNVLTPLAYHFRREEKLLIYEYMPKSSLLYVLHGDRGIFHSELNWPTRLRIIQGIGRGMDFLHREFATYDLPHGNLKSSNVLLSENYDPVLSDYAFLPLIHTTNVAQALFAFKSPENIQHQQISPKSDVYCLGLIILEILTGKFPSQYLSNGKGGTNIVEWVQSSFAEQKEEELIDPEIAENKDSVGEMVKLLQIGVACIESNPEERLEMSEAIRRIEEIQT